MITVYDLVNIAFYFVFIAGVGIYFSRRSRDTSDYFRAGGALPWWMTGASAWMAAFSAWTFTGAAGKMYETGPFVLLGPYYSILVPYLVLLLFTCYRFRRMRVVTPLEAVRLRFGGGAQQVVTWLRLPMILIFGGVGLNAVAVFMAAVFGAPIHLVMIVLGVAVTVLALLGGSIAVVASDFVQMFLKVAVTVTVAVLALSQADIGGLSGMIEKAPAAHHDWSHIARPEFIAFYVMAFITTKMFEENSMDKAAKFLMAGSDRDARKMLIIPIVGSLLGPLIWVIPPTVAAIRHPDMAQLFPALRFPNEAAFLQTAFEVMPVGMLGLLVAGIFAATLTTLDAAMNQGAGIFVRNFYLPVVNPNCDEKRLLVLSKVVTGVLGGLVVVIGLAFNELRSLGLFDLLNQVAASLSLPIVIPLFLGLYYKRTPAWSVWTTIAIGLACALFAKFVLQPSHLSGLPMFQGPYTPDERTQFTFYATVFLVATVCTAWFFFTSLFYERSPVAYRRNVDEFFERLGRPIEASESPAEEAGEQSPLTATIGRLCMIYGGFLWLLAVIVPNEPTGRLCFVACGALMVFPGWAIARSQRAQDAARAATAEQAIARNPISGST